MDMNQAREGKVTATDINNALTNVQTLLTRYEKHIRDCLPIAEAEKPKLRHADYGLNCNGVPFFINRDMIQWVKAIGRPNASLEGNETMTKAVVFGNLEEDLAAIAEELPEFTTDVQIETVVVKD